MLGVSKTGSLDWTQTLGGATNENVRDLASDPRGNGVVVTGGFSQTATFGSLGSITSRGYYDAFAVRLSNQGNFEWVSTAGGFGQDQAWGVRCDALGNTVVSLSYGDRLQRWLRHRTLPRWHPG